jgi:hypothetical protein
MEGVEVHFSMFCSNERERCIIAVHRFGLKYREKKRLFSGKRQPSFRFVQIHSTTVIAWLINNMFVSVVNERQNQ